MPQGHRDEQAEAIDEAARTFDRLLATMNETEEKMTRAKQEWVEASAALMEQYLVLRELMEGRTP